MTFLVKHEANSAPLALMPADLSAFGRYAPTQSGETLTIDFRGVTQALLRRKWWLIVPMVLAMAGGIVGAMLVVPRYTSAVQILVDPREIQLVRPDATLRTQVPEAINSGAENAIVMLRSSSLLMKVIDAENLTEDPEFVGKNAMGEPAEALRLRALMALDKRVSARRAERSSVVEALVITTDQVKSARIANTLASAFLELQASSESDTARKAAKSVSSRLDELGARVQKAEREVEEYKARNNLQTANGKLVNEQQLQELNSQLVLARTRTSEARSKYEGIRKLSLAAIERGDLQDAASSTIIAQLRLKYAEASRLEADARTKLGTKHPEMAAISAQVRDMRALISDELSRISRSAQAEFERAKASEDTLSGNLDQLKSRSSDSSGASLRLRELERQSDASKEIYNSFLKRARELGEQEDISTVNARIISPATPAQYASSISRSVVLVGASVAGVMIGLMLALLAEQFDQTIRSRKQFQHLSGLPVLGELNESGSRRRNREISAHVIERPHSAFALGACRVADAFAAQTAPRRVRSVLFLSLSPQVNLTEAVLNISIAAAQATWRVLMVDADTSGNGLSRSLDLQPHFGLADVIERRCSLTGAILTDDRTDVRILPGVGASRAPHSARRLSPQMVHAEILTPAQGFELMFVDGGILGRDAAAMAFAGAVDDIVLVAAEGQTTSKALRDAMEQLQMFQGKLRGIITA